MTPSPLVALQAAFVVLFLPGSCDRRSDPPPPGEIFTDQAQRSGMVFVHENGMTGKRYFNEIVGPGSALFDFDNDGDLDVFLLQGRRLDAEPPAAGPLGRLYRNDLDLGSGLHFTDVTASTGIEATSYGMGAATGDFDNDGWTDLYLTGFGDNQLWHNRGLGPEGNVTFADVTAASGTGEPRWSTSAAFVDLDRDGWLDLFVVNYTDFRIASHQPCVNELGEGDYCGPRSYEPETDRLFRNLGDGTFVDLSAEVGLLAAPGPGQGVVVADVDRDGWPDLYVANDQAPNHLWRNRMVTGESGALFAEEALVRGCALDAQGRAQASMGVDAGDVDGDGDVDLFTTHLLREVNTLYLNDGRGLFTDRTTAAGLGAPSIGLTGFGAALADFDRDGWLDILVVNGAVRTIAGQRQAGAPMPLRQPNQLFLNQGGTFVEASHRAPVLALPYVSRGAAVGDLDNDGAPDVLVNNNAGPAQLLVNLTGTGAHWLGIRLLTADGRDALGAELAFHRSGAPALHRRVRSDGSFLVARDPRVLFGLGENSAPGRLAVTWPQGRRERWEGLALDRYHTLTEGGGEPIPEADSG